MVNRQRSQSESKPCQMKESYGTLSETVNGLKQDGYSLDFNLRHDCLVCEQTGKELSPSSFEIDKAFRFEGPSDPGDEAIVYAISSPSTGMKGVLVNGYGISADPISDALVQKLRVHH
jgi:hypothetical protein